MLIILKRTWKTGKSTIGVLYVYHDGDTENSIFRCFTLEDIEREKKIRGQTAIPKGVYNVAWTESYKFRRNVLMIENVPDFDRIYFHAGNKHEDTEGCILLGLVRRKDFIDFSTQAVAAFQRLIGDAIEKGEKITITIT